MKQFKFFASLAMVALAACTNDGLELEPIVQKPGQGRPEANFVISVNENIAQTRAEFGLEDGSYNWIFQPGDKIGAMLMDEWDGEGEEMTNFDITDYAQTNYPVIRNANGEWSAHQDMNPLAGNYFFYFPYEPVKNARGHFGFSVNPNQPQYNKDGELFAYQPVVDNQKYLAYDFIPVKDYDGNPTNVNLNFVPVFAMPTFQFINKTSVDLIVHKVAIRTTVDPDAGIYNKNVNDLIATTMAIVPGTAGFESVRGQWTNESGNYDKERSLMWSNAIRYTNGVDAPEATEDENYKWPKHFVKCENEMETLEWDPETKPFYPLSKDYEKTYLQQAAYEYVADYTGVTDKYIVKPFNKIQSLLVMPAGYYNVEAMEALVYVSPTTAPNDKYVVRIPLLTDSYVSDDVTSIAGHKYLAPGKITKFFAEFDAAGMESYDITKFQITSSEDLKWIVEQAKDHTGDYNLIVNTSGSRVVLTKEIEEILANIPQVHLFVNGNITIAADASSDAINKLHFSIFDKVETNLTVLNEQIATKDILNCGKITVKKGGAILNEKHCIKSKCMINNYGKIVTPELSTKNFNNYGEASITDNSYGCDKQALNVTNYEGAKLNVKRLGGHVVNYGSAEIDIVTPVYENGKEVFPGGNITNHAEATVGTVIKKAENKSGATLTITKSVFDLVNAGTTNIKGAIGNTAQNSGSINVTGTTSAYKFDNAATGTINVNAALTENTTLTNNGTVNVAAGAEILAPGQGKVNNAGTINVEGKLKENVYSKGLINVIGNGIVIAKDIFDNTAGIIDVTKANNTDVAHAAKSNSQTMYFRYTVNVDNATKLAENELYPRISEENYTKNRIILVWDATSPAKYNGTLALDDVNVTDVIINRELLLDGNTRFQDAVNVAINKQVTVGNGATSTGFNCGSAVVTISDILKVNNHGSLSGEAKYTGAGIIELVGANSKMSWTEGANWTGKINK